MMQLTYDPQVDAASVLVRGPIARGTNHSKDRLDADRFIRSSETDGSILAYEFLNVRRHGVRVDDLEHCAELTALFTDAGFAVRDWSDPTPARVSQRRRDIATG